MIEAASESALPRLIGLIDGSLLRSRDLDPERSAAELALELVDSGVSCLVYRDAEIEVTDMVTIAREIRSAIDPGYGGVKLLVQDRIGVAIGSGADGVVVANAGVEVADVYRTMGPEAIVALAVFPDAPTERQTPERPPERPPERLDDISLVLLGHPEFRAVGDRLPELVETAKQMAPMASVVACADSVEDARAARRAGLEGVAFDARRLSGTDGRALVAEVLECFGEEASIGPDDEGRHLFVELPAER